jgi:hypothetical protein
MQNRNIWAEADVLQSMNDAEIFGDIATCASPLPRPGVAVAGRQGDCWAARLRTSLIGGD